MSAAATKKRVGLFIFRRDLRLNDNTTLVKALTDCDAVVPCFIADPRQVSPKLNAFHNYASLRFMINSLEDLDKQIAATQQTSQKGNTGLVRFWGQPHDVLDAVFQGSIAFDAVYCNRDYTPFSKARDSAMAEVARKHKVDFVSLHDTLLQEPDVTVKSSDKKPYTVFTPFYRNSSAMKVKPIAPLMRQHSQKLWTDTTSLGVKEDLLITAEDFRKMALDTAPKGALPDVSLVPVQGGRTEGLRILSSIGTACPNYDQTRDDPMQKTTNLASHLKFGTVSAREAYWRINAALKGTAKDTLIKQLYWRDFFHCIGNFFPHVFGEMDTKNNTKLKGAFRPTYDAIPWSTDRTKFKAWCEGKTGQPFVDAGMRELNQSGTMHNRLRMVVASFLTKDLGIDWRWGEQYFAQKLIDYDPCVNNGSWQWAASTGCDAQPYFRIFNCFRQQARFDPECAYIKKWVPELRPFTPKMIASHETQPLRKSVAAAAMQKKASTGGTPYPDLIVPHSESKKVVGWFANCGKKAPVAEVVSSSGSDDSDDESASSVEVVGQKRNRPSNKK